MKKLIFSAALLSLAFGSCDPYNGPVIDPRGTGCVSGIAQVGVGDGFIEYLCGCTGQPDYGTTLHAPGTLTCHVPAGTYVLFQFIDIHTTHQMISTSGGLSFVSGLIVQPGDGTTNTAALFSDVGTYNFEDAFDTAINGQIIVP